MIYLKPCLPKGNLLDAAILLVSISFIEIGLLIDECCILQFQFHQIL